jgi:histone acetyltransferase (RNA polymerase elongator complex component)
MEACPFRCIFCDQERISGRSAVPSPEDVIANVTQHLLTIPEKDSEVEVGFFGGTFTGLSRNRQESYLQTVLPFVETGKVSGIRLSTRPDFINPDILNLLGKYQVKTIELGAQSMDDLVLKRSGRGHTSMDTVIASRMILDAGFSLGLQMMIGLPGDTEERSVQTARRIIELGASETRIYPVIVIKGTPLEDLFRKKKYLPMELEQAVAITKKVVNVFDRSYVNIIRIGLHPSEGLLNKTDYVAGPFHPSFRELVMTSVWTDRLSILFKEQTGKRVVIRVNPLDLHPAIGYYGKNRKLLEQHYRSVKFIADPLIIQKTFYADHS